MVKPDKTPEQILGDAVTAMEKFIIHAASIAHAKKAFYDAFIAEGFTKEEALELCKDITRL